MKIKELIVYTTSLKEQIHFYHQKLELEIVSKTENSTSFQIGKSTLTFKSAKNSVPYHFAFNIPAYKEHEALNWLKERVSILTYEEDEIINFSNWNARAIYFYDADNNIVEFISRRNLNNKTSNFFNSKQLLNISEIGITTNNIETIYNALNMIKPIPIFDGSFDKFCAIGNDIGLFILVNIDKKDWFPTDDTIYMADFILKGDYNFEYKGGIIIKSY